MAQSSHYPTVLIILGATGDLVRRKIAPALYNLYTEGLLPDNFQIVASLGVNFPMKTTEPIYPPSLLSIATPILLLSNRSSTSSSTTKACLTRNPATNL